MPKVKRNFLNRLCIIRKNFLFLNRFWIYNFELSFPDTLFKYCRLPPCIWFRSMILMNTDKSLIFQISKLYHFLHIFTFLRLFWRKIFHIYLERIVFALFFYIRYIWFLILEILNLRFLISIFNCLSDFLFKRGNDRDLCRINWIQWRVAFYLLWGIAFVLGLCSVYFIVHFTLGRVNLIF